KARRAGLPVTAPGRSRRTRAQLAAELFEIARQAQGRGWSAEELLRAETRKRERAWRKAEAGRDS
ncbi:MAG: MazG family protein, partial [Verrucomicrobia bacterium]|nr:MazG family protein [Verrucomicrobiota bacterium]